MRIEIDAEGAHEPLPHHMIVDGHGILVDLRLMPGPFQDAGGDIVARILYDDRMLDEQTRQVGEILRKQRGNAAFGRQPIFKTKSLPDWLQGYLDHYRERLAAAGT